MRKEVFFLLIVLAVSIHGKGKKRDKVLLKKLTAITLEDGKMTNARRSPAIRQLECVGGSAGCHGYRPKVVQCVNTGHDGYDVQWKCKTEMNSKYRFGKITVSCEGYDYPDDPYVLRGSCGLRYELDRTGKGRTQKKKSTNRRTNQRTNKRTNQRYRRKYKKSFPITEFIITSIVVLLLIIGVIIYYCLKACNCCRNCSRRRRRSGSSSYSSRGYHKSDDDDSSCCEGFCKGFCEGFCKDFCDCFWSTAIGGIIGYMIGSQSGNGTSNSEGDRNSADKSEGDSDTTSRTATGYGGVTRR